MLTNIVTHLITYFENLFRTLVLRLKKVEPIFLLYCSFAVIFLKKL